MTTKEEKLKATIDETAAAKTAARQEHQTINDGLRQAVADAHKTAPTRHEVWKSMTPHAIYNSEGVNLGVAVEPIDSTIHDAALALVDAFGEELQRADQKVRDADKAHLEACRALDALNSATGWAAISDPVKRQEAKEFEQRKALEKQIASEAEYKALVASGKIVPPPPHKPASVLDRQLSYAKRGAHSSNAGAYGPAHRSRFVKPPVTQ